METKHRKGGPEGAKAHKEVTSKPSAKRRTPEKILAQLPSKATEDKGFVFKLVGDSIKVWFGDSWQKCDKLVNKTIPDLFISNEIHPLLPLLIEKEIIDRGTEVKNAFLDILAFSFISDIRKNIPGLRGCSSRLGSLQVQKMTPQQKIALEGIINNMLTFMAVSSFLSTAFKGLSTDKKNAAIAMLILPRLDDLILKEAPDIPKEIRAALLKEIYINIKF